MEMKKADNYVAPVSPASIPIPTRRTSGGPRTYNQLSKLHHFFGDNVPLTNPEAKQVAKVNKFFGEDFPSKFFESQHQKHRLLRKNSILPSYFKHAASYPERSPASPDDIDSGFDGDYNSDDEMGISVKATKESSIDKSKKPALVSHQRKWNSESDPGNFVKRAVCPDSATFEEMVDFFINPRTSFDSNDLDAFIVCLPSFSNPLSLMSVLRKRFETSQDSTDSSLKKEEILEMRLRQIKILEFLNDWLRSVGGMEDLRRCSKLRQNVRTFLETKNCDLDVNTISRMEQLKQVLEMITTHATCELDIRQDLVVQSEVCETIADDDLPTDHKKRRSASVGMSPIFGSSPDDRNRGRKKLQHVRSWRLRYYKHRSLPAPTSPTVKTTKRPKPAQGRGVAAALPSTSVGSCSLLSDGNERIRSLRKNFDRKLRSKDASAESSTQASSAESDDGQTPARLAKDTLCSTIASKTRKSSRAPLAAKVARSLTMADIKLLGSIHPRELVERRWRSQDKDRLAPNVMNAIKDFDRRVNWVTSILLTAKPGKVQTSVKFFLAVADNLLKLHNFNGYMQVAYGISTPWLGKGRWKTECESLRPKHRAKWMELQRVADISSHRFTEYRALKRSVLASDRSKCARRVPCWNVLLSDIHGVDAKMKWFFSGKKEVEGSRINVTKMLKLHKCMQNNLYCGHMGGYTNIQSDASFDHQVKQSLAASLSEVEILKLVQRELSHSQKQTGV